MKYTKEFKLTLVKLVESGQSKVDVAKEYDVDRGVLGRWLREHKSDKESFSGHGNASLSTEQKTIRDLEKKLREMTIERDILKNRNACRAYTSSQGPTESIWVHRSP